MTLWALLFSITVAVKIFPPGGRYTGAVLECETYVCMYLTEL